MSALLSCSSFWLRTTRFVFSTLAAAVTIEAQPLSPADYAARPSIGINLEYNSFQSPQIMFVDVFKQALPWVARPENDGNVFNSGLEVPTDDRGWPRQVPFIVDGSTPQIAQTLMMNNLDGHYPGGVYTVRFEGSGELLIAGDAEAQLLDTAGSYRVNVTPTNDGIYLALFESDPTDPIQNIEVIMPGHAATARDQPFNPAYLDYLRPFDVLRTQQILVMNDEGYGCDAGSSVSAADCVRTAAGRVQEAYAFQAGPRGIAIEYLVDLVNELDADLWLNILHATDNDYVDDVAGMVAGRMEDDRTVFLELSNEAWNPSPEYPQYHYFINKGIAEADQDVRWAGIDDVDTGARWFAHRWAETAHRFSTALAPAGIRLVRVLPSFSELTTRTVRLLHHLDDPFVNPHGVTPDAVAVACYMGVALPVWANEAADRAAAAGETFDLAAETAPDNLVTWIRQNISTEFTDPFGSGETSSSVPAIFNRLRPHLPNGVPLIAYEGGQHLSYYGDFEQHPAVNDNMAAAIQHPGMADFYRELFAAWFGEGGGLVCSYANFNALNRTGGFGIRRHLETSLASEHRWRGHLDAIAGLSTTVTRASDQLIVRSSAHSPVAIDLEFTDRQIVRVTTTSVRNAPALEFSGDLLSWQEIPFLEDAIAPTVFRAALPAPADRIFFRRAP